MTNWIRILFLGIFSLLFSVNTYGKDSSHNNYLFNLSETEEERFCSEDSCILSSDLFYAGRTLNHLMKTRSINASAAFCLSNTSSNDYQNNKFILPVMTIQHHFICGPKVVTGKFLYINPHSRIPHSKNYYIFTLEKIII